MTAKLIVDIRDDIFDMRYHRYEFIGFEKNQYSEKGYLFLSRNEFHVSLHEIRKIGNWEYSCEHIWIGGQYENMVFWKPVKPINAHVAFNELLGSIKNKENYYD